MHIQNFDPYHFSKKNIHGIPIFYKYLPWAPCIHTHFVFKTGALCDPEGKEGLAHFLEHMIGNGSPRFPDKKTVKEFNRLYMLNSRNAYTSYFSTVYFGKCLPEDFLSVLRMTIDTVFNPLLRPEDVEHERRVISQEAWGVYRNNKFLNYVKNWSDNIHHENELRRLASPLGWPETIHSISRADILQFHKEKYVKENLSIFIVGAITEEHLTLMENLTDKIPSGKKTKVSVGEIKKPKVSRHEIQSDEIGHPNEQVQFTLYRASHEMDKGDYETGVNMETLLYDILFERLRVEHSLCYHVAVKWNRNKFYCEAEISVNTSIDKIEIVEREIWNAINEIIEGKWRDRFDTLHTLNMKQLRSKERLSDVVIQNSINEFVTTDSIRTLDEVLLSFKKVTYEKIQEMIRYTFDPNYCFTEIILPTKKDSVEG